MQELADNDRNVTITFRLGHLPVQYSPVCLSDILSACLSRLSKALTDGIKKLKQNINANSIRYYQEIVLGQRQ
jgi:hypothetical protein